MKKQGVFAWLLLWAILCALVACSVPTPQAYTANQENPTSPVPLYCRAQGQLVQQPELGVPATPEQDVRTYIYQGLLAEQTEIDISAYQIPVAQIVELYTDVINHHPDLFFVQSGISYTYTSGSMVVVLKPSYRMSGEELAQARELCAQKLDEICSGVDVQWSDYEIALYLHDYLCLHFAYDTSYEIYDMYQFLTTGKGVCQAYTLTYMELLSRFGIASDVAVSESMNHIWNVITLGGQPYHVDVTWDDPVPDAPGTARHVNFLRSDAGIAESGHYGWVSDLVCSSDAYDATFVTNVDLPFSYTAGTWLYADGKARAVYAVDFSTMSKQSVVEIQDKWIAPGGHSYYVDAFVGAGTYRGNLIYNTNEKIYAYNLQSGVTVEINASLPHGLQIFGLMVEGDTVTYWVSDSPDSLMQAMRCTVADLADYLWGDADQNGVVDGRDVTAVRRYLEDLPTVCHTGAADVDDSGSIDQRDVEILRQYLVENN